MLQPGKGFGPKSRIVNNLACKLHVIANVAPVCHFVERGSTSQSAAVARGLTQMDSSIERPWLPEALGFALFGNDEL